MSQYKMCCDYMLPVIFLIVQDWSQYNLQSLFRGGGVSFVRLSYVVVNNFTITITSYVHIWALNLSILHSIYVV